MKRRASRHAQLVHDCRAAMHLLPNFMKGERREDGYVWPTARSRPFQVLTAFLREVPCLISVDRAKCRINVACADSSSWIGVKPHSKKPGL